MEAGCGAARLVLGEEALAEAVVRAAEDLSARNTRQLTIPLRGGGAVLPQGVNAAAPGVGFHLHQDSSLKVFKLTHQNNHNQQKVVGSSP